MLNQKVVMDPLPSEIRPASQRGGARDLAWAAWIGLSALALAFGAGAAIDPAYVFDRLWVYASFTVSISVLVGAGYYAAEWWRDRTVPWWVAALRLGGAVAIGFFVWLRPGVAIAMPTIDLAIKWIGALLAAGAAANLILPFRRRVDIAAWWRFPRRGALALLVAVCAGLALIAAAPIVQRHWDMSGYMDSHGYDTYAMNIVTGRMPEGSSAYMPVYQYGLALIYWVFGHFYFVQQIVNVILATASVAALCLAAWTLYGSAVAVILAGVVAAFSRQFFYAVGFTQIESWYVPFICFLLLAWARYWRQPTWLNLAGLGLMVALGINTRNQGLLFFAFVCLAPLMVAGLPWRRRLVQVAVIGLLVGASLIPWTIRNYVVEGRLSPGGSRSAMYIGVLNDRRIGLYGIRYWEGWGDVSAEFAANYPDPAERERAYARAGWTNVVSDPAWLARAMFWRTAAYYGLLPNGYFDLAAITPTNWTTDWRGYVFWRTTPLLLLLLSVIAVVIRPNRTNLFLWGAVVSNLVILVLSATPEDRISYPALTIHLLLAVGLFASGPPPLPQADARRRRPVLVWLAAGVAAIVFVVLCRGMLGSRFTYRTIMEPGVAIVPSLEIDQTLPLLNDVVAAGAAPDATAWPTGERVRVRCQVSNYMRPPKFSGAVPGLPPFATDPRRETYFYAYPLSEGNTPVKNNQIGITYLGAQLSEVIREGDAVEIEAVIVHSPTTEQPGYWVHALEVKKLPIPRDALPPF
jgi:hypothetical protein